MSVDEKKSMLMNKTMMNGNETIKNNIGANKQISKCCSQKQKKY